MRLPLIEIGQRQSLAILFVILAIVGLCSTLAAMEKPLWYDEVSTVILCRLPNISEMWNALDNAADTNPPGFYLTAAGARRLVPEDHVGYRLPSIVGLLITLSCIYSILARTVSPLAALVGVAFALCTPLAEYAFEARPYSLMVACVAAAILSWQRIDESKVYWLAFAISLAAAVSMHYYAIFVWPAFALAELSVVYWDRRFRIKTWLALLLASLPFLAFAKLLLHLRQYYGQHFSAKPSINLIFGAPTTLFNTLNHWGWAFSIASAVILLYWIAARKSDSPMPMRVSEYLLAVGFLLLPVIAIGASKITGGGMTSRYMMPMILGGALAAGYFASKASHGVNALLILVMLGIYGLFTTPVLAKTLQGTLFERREAAIRQAKDPLSGRESDVPVVISSGLQYLPLAYYGGSAAKVSTIVDPEAAVRFAETDSVDLALLVLRRYFPLHVDDYGSFAAKHQEFMLVSTGGLFDWWPTKLSHDGNALSLISSQGGNQLYKVTLLPQRTTSNDSIGAQPRTSRPALAE